MTLAKFDITLGLTSVDVHVNDLPLLASPVEVQIIKGGQYEPPSVALVFEAGEVTVNGEGIVEARGESEDLVRFLEAIDSKALEAAALERSTFEGSLTPVMLDVLKEWASAT